MSTFFRNPILFIGYLIVILLDLVCVGLQAFDAAYSGHSEYINFGAWTTPVTGTMALLAAGLGSIAIMLSMQIKLLNRIILCLLLLVFSITAICLAGMLQGVSESRQERWFLRTGIVKYTECIRAIESRRGALTGSEEQIASELKIHPFRCESVYGCTNIDGSLYVAFVGCYGYAHQEYIYYTGHPYKVYDEALQLYVIYRGMDPVYKMTNNWYSYNY